MIVFIEVFAGWIVLLVGAALALWIGNRAQCRAGAHTWWWEGGQWVCGRCGAPDDRTNREVTR